MQLVVERRIEVGSGERLEVVPAWQERQRPVLERALQAGDVVLQTRGVGVRTAFVDRMHQPVDAHPVIEDADSPANDQASVGLPGVSQTGREVAQRNTILSGRLAVEYANPGWQRASAALADCARVVVVGYYVTDERVGIGLRGSARRNRHRLQIACPEIGQVAILIGERAIVLPTDA